MSFQGLPPIPVFLELQTRPNWVAWKHAVIDGRQKKPPINPWTGGLADPSAPETWGTYQAALARAQNEGLAGVGFVLNGEGDLIGIDIDADKKTGCLDPELETIARLGETYTERSPSGRGYRMFARGALAEEIIQSGIEVYRTKRYLTATGAHVHGTPLEIRPAPRTLAALKRLADGQSERIQQNTSQGGQGPRPSSTGATGDNFWGRVNRAALDGLDAWVPHAFPGARRNPKGWRVTSRRLGRNLQEDLSLTRDGIKDFGVHDLGDATKGRRSSVRLLVEHGIARSDKEAAFWLCDHLGIRPEDLGWIDWTTQRQSRPKAAQPQADRAQPVATAREAIKRAIREHFAAADTWADKQGRDVFEEHAINFNNVPTPPPVHAIRVPTGVGKTQIAAQIIAERIKAQPGRRYLYAVPTHKLGDEIVRKFTAHGTTARVFRGRSAPDPERDGKTMCDDLEAVKIALDLGATVSTSCCKGKTPKGETVTCPFYTTCSYQQQISTPPPDVWIVPHQLLFQAQSGLGKVAGIFIDESFWQSGLWTSKRGLTLDEIGAPITAGVGRRQEAEPLRQRLHEALTGHSDKAGVQRRALVAAGLTDASQCSDAISAEWSMKPKPMIYPGMDREHRRTVAQITRGAKHIQAFVNVWNAARHLLNEDDENAVSGRLWLDTTDTDEGTARVVKVRGVKSIAAQWNAPTFIMDATLPDEVIIKGFYPQVETIADLDVKLPHVTVRQILGAPVAKKKLFDTRSDAQRNLKALRRYILQRWIEVERKPTLVIVQKDVEAWLKEAELPAGITIRHFNAIAGIDAHAHDRLVIVAGRTQPGPFEFEAFAGALTGREPIKAGIQRNGGTWFDRVERTIRLKDGAGSTLPCDQHPDPIAEAFRWQVCEGELMQAIGRGRGVNRTAATPLDIDILADVALPITVHDAPLWENELPPDYVEMIAEGVWLESPTDMHKAFPAVWASQRDAERAAAEFPANLLYKSSPKAFWRGIPPPWLVTFRTAGRGQKTRRAWFNLSLIPDPRVWLEARLGPLAHFEFEPEPVVEEPAPEPDGLTPKRVAPGRLVLVEEPLAFHSQPPPLPLRDCPRAELRGGQRLFFNEWLEAAE